ncbi:hypothetical protein MYAER_0208 [Microcystis aeruginosa NIES-2549]|uniref:Uncharacterized protein n=1 Tax=Microcystis aeruginosa NIES-2549 TaxID=1641812 RepID=A0A0F6U0N1_MICAE|nr:hypothetical protein MYAER_0208 [Microcystis aeruginosa NIES-2549]
MASGGLIPTLEIFHDGRLWPRPIIEEIMTLSAIVGILRLELTVNSPRRYRHATRR